MQQVYRIHENNHDSKTIYITLENKNQGKKKEFKYM